jgi:hypothetical protein
MAIARIVAVAAASNVRRVIGKVMVWAPFTGCSIL